MAQYINSNKPFVMSLNFDPNEASDLKLTFKQGTTELVKTKADLETNIADTIEADGRWAMPFAFTLEESNGFESGEFIELQMMVVIGDIQDYTNLAQMKLTDIL